MSRLIVPKENVQEFFRKTYDKTHNQKIPDRDAYEEIVILFRNKALGLCPSVGGFKRLPTQRQLDFAFQKAMATAGKQILSKYTSLFTLSEARISDSPCIYEYFTREYVSRLMHVLGQLSDLAMPGKKFRISELGAGYGHFASEIEKYYSDICNIKAYDNFSWRMVIPESLPIVQPMIQDIPITLAKSSPDVVISSWMPWQENWVGLFPRKLDCYILIGEAFGGCCGDENTHALLSPEWARYDLGQVLGPQLARTDLVEKSLLEIFDDKSSKRMHRLRLNYPHSRTLLYVRNKWRKAAEAILSYGMCMPE